METETLKFADLNTCITGAEQGLNDLTVSFESITTAFKGLNEISEVPTTYKCPQCGNMLFVYTITEVDVVFYCKNCNRKVKGRI